MILPITLRKINFNKPQNNAVFQTNTNVIKMKNVLNSDTVSFGK